jgi:hypothetical protein
MVRSRRFQRNQIQKTSAPSSRSKNKNRKAFITIGIVAIAAVAIASFFLLERLQSSFAKVDIIAKIHDDLSPDTSPLERDWVNYSKVYVSSCYTFVNATSWEQFIDSFRHTSINNVLMLDQKAQVIWFEGSGTQITYYDYS